MNVDEPVEELCAIGYGGVDLDFFPESRTIVQLLFRQGETCTTDLTQQDVLNLVLYDDSDGNMLVSCGSWNTEPANTFPDEFMPAGCDEVDIQANY